MNYTFTFTEMQYGSVTIESDHEPDRDEVIEAVLDGRASYYNTEWEDVSLAEAE